MSGTKKRRRTGEKGRLRSIQCGWWGLQLLGAAFVSGWGKNYATSMSPSHQRGSGRSLRAQRRAAQFSPVHVLNHAFICLPIETDAKCP